MHRWPHKVWRINIPFSKNLQRYIFTYSYIYIHRNYLVQIKKNETCSILYKIEACRHIMPVYTFISCTKVNCKSNCNQTTFLNKITKYFLKQIFWKIPLMIDIQSTHRCTRNIWISLSMKVAKVWYRFYNKLNLKCDEQKTNFDGRILNKTCPFVLKKTHTNRHDPRFFNCRCK